MVLHFLLVYNKLLEFCSLLQYLWSLIWIFIFYARTLKIVIFSYYTKHRSKVRCALLDVSKAFDMVDHGHLFDLLLQYNYQVLHFLFSAVLSMGTLSTSFRVTNGVWKGGILSYRVCILCNALRSKDFHRHNCSYKQRIALVLAHEAGEAPRT